MKIKGQVISQPLVITSKKTTIVMLIVRTSEGCKELYYVHTHYSNCLLAEKYVRTKFSLIALSAIGDNIEAHISTDTGEIFSFENKTQDRKY